MCNVRMRGVASLSGIAVLVLVGCRDDTTAKRLDKPEYLRQIRAVEASAAARRADTLFFQIVVDPPLPQRVCQARTAEFHRLLGEIVDRIEQLRAPADVAGLQRQFVADARDSVEAVGEAADDVAARKLRCGTAMNRRIYGLRSTRRANADLREYARRGYIIGLNSP